MEELRRRLGVTGAAAIGVASMLGAGIFFVWAPAAAAAGAGLLAGLGIAALVATANALSTTRLAVISPVSGGGYIYAGRHLAPTAGFAAGVLFLFGKVASVAAIAGVAGSYLWPTAARPIAVALIVVLAVVNATGIRSTALVSGVLAALVIAALLGTMTVAAMSPDGAAHELSARGGAWGVLQSGSLAFFAFAGYARVATLAEEVRDPARTLPRATLLALGCVLAVSFATAAMLLNGLGVDRLAASTSPVADLAGPEWHVAIRIAAGIACAGSLLGVLAGLSRTGLAMARGGDLPRVLARVNPRSGTPIVAEIVVATTGAVATLLLDPVILVGASAAAVLGYYALIHVASLRAAGPRMARWRAVSVAGLAGCLVLAAAAPLRSALAAAAVLLVALAARHVARVILARRAGRA